MASFGNPRHKVVKYSDPRAILSDSELVTEEVAEDPEGDLSAVVVSFDLPPSSYATVGIRELCKGGVREWREER